MKKLKLMTIIGTRPEIIRLSETIKLNDQLFNHVLVHTGQNWDYKLNKIFFENLEIREPDYFLDTVGNDLGETIGNIISKTYNVMYKEKPDALLVLGDTNSCLSVIPAKRLKIPIFHMEAGNRCYDMNVPEEINRRIVDHTSDVNMPYTEHSRRNLISEGLPSKYIIVTGSPMREVLVKYSMEIENSKILEILNLEKQKYILVSAHREENLDNDRNFVEVVKTLNYLAEEFNMPIIYSTHPRTKKKIIEKGVVFHENIINLEPFGFFDYNFLQMNSFVTLSDSGTLSEESNILKFPAVLFRTTTERPEAIDKGSIVIGGISHENVIQAINIAVSDKFYTKDVLDYFDDNVSEKVCKVIQGYTQSINKFVWMKE